LVILFFTLLAISSAARLKYIGVNEAGAEFAPQNLPGVLGKDYIFPTTSSIDYFVSNGMNTIRIPFLWERYQPTFQSVDQAYQKAFEEVVNYTTKAGAYALIDPHNYNRYRDQPIGTSSVPVSAFRDFWIVLANRFRNNPKVIFGLMNEPNGVTTESVLTAMQSAINGIRSTGSKHLIFVPGNAWTGAWSWTQNWYGTSNANVMGKIKDPANNMVFELHQYLDQGYSGTVAECLSSWNPSALLDATTNWMRQSKARAFIGEFGFGPSDNCLRNGDSFLNYLEANSDVYVGWTYWSAGPWWGDYFTNVEPGKNRPQMAILKKHSSGSVPTRVPPPPNTSQDTPKPTQPSSDCSPLYGQCGGKNWSGPTCCSQGSCKPQNEWYSQCA
jgi:endoglucanase